MTRVANALLCLLLVGRHSSQTSAREITSWMLFSSISSLKIVAICETCLLGKFEFKVTFSPVLTLIT